jgi:predicted short-subunit dehydrogenase-like oxidoreductase (DUF2520 family)
MRELDWLPPSLAVIGPGRLGRALAAALRASGCPVAGPLGRGAAPTGVDAVLLCVPDAAIAQAAALVPPGPLVGHCSGATGLDVLAGREAFSLHPLMAVPASGAAFAGAACAVAGSSEPALALARLLAGRLGMVAAEVADEDRAAYHAAASLAANFLVTLEVAAERLAATAGVDRAALAPLVRAAAEHWARDGAEALTGPIARGDGATVARQRAAVADRAPDLLPVFDALAHATRELAAVPA